MKKRIILIAAVVAGIFGAAFTSNARGRGCYSETRSEAIKLCEMGFHQRAIEYFEAAKKCSDAPSRNDIDALIAACRSHMSDFTISKMELGNTDSYREAVCAWELPLYKEDLLYLTPRITYTSTKSETLTLGIKIFEPDGSLSGSEDNEYSYITEIKVEPGSNQVEQLVGWGTANGGSYDPGKYRIEIWCRGKMYASRDFEVLDGRDPDKSHYNIAGESGDDDSPAGPEEGLLKVNGQSSEVTIEFGKIGAIVHVNVENNTGEVFETNLLPEFCEVTGVTANGFELSCEPNKTPATRADWFLVRAGENYVTVNVKQASYVNANYLRVDGKEEYVTSEYSFEGGKVIFYVETDGPEFCFWGIPSFCHVENQKPDSFFLVCEPNDMKVSRSDYFYVMVGDKKVEVNVYQEGDPDGIAVEDDFDGDPAEGDVNTFTGYENLISSPAEWLSEIKNMMDNPTITYNDGSCYKGQLNENGDRDGYGIYYWPVGSYYIGQWKDGQRSGMGIYLIGDHTYNFSNCPEAKVYVGHWENGVANGVGSCYDSEGNLIYDGVFTDSFPGDDYPNGENFSGYKFQIFHITSVNNSGRWYIGETYYTNRHGWGLLMWDDFDCCFGKWEDDNRTNHLFMDRAGKTIEMRDYTED